MSGKKKMNDKPLNTLSDLSEKELMLLEKQRVAKESVEMRYQYQQQMLDYSEDDTTGSSFLQNQPSTLLQQLQSSSSDDDAAAAASSSTQLVMPNCYSTFVDLNVGGILFTTSLATLRSDPDSILMVMFDECRSAFLASSQHPVAACVQQQPFPPVCIDRDGTHFRYVLNYLRCGAADVVLPDDQQSLRELRCEADFYQLNELKALTDAKLSPVPPSSNRSLVTFSVGDIVCWKPEMITYFWQKFGCLFDATSEWNSAYGYFRQYSLFCFGCQQSVPWIYRKIACCAEESLRCDFQNYGLQKGQIQYLMKNLRGVIVKLVGDSCCEVDWSSEKYKLHLPLDVITVVAD